MSCAFMHKAYSFAKKHSNGMNKAYSHFSNMIFKCSFVFMDKAYSLIQNKEVG